MRCTLAFLIFSCCLALLFSQTRAKTVTFKDCGSVEAVVHSVNITPCTNEPCDLKVGTNVTGTTTFTPNEAVQSGEVKAWAIFGLTPVPLSFLNPNLCEGYGVTCPLKSKVAAKVVLKIFIRFPPLSLILKTQVKDQNGSVLLCVEASFKISE